MKRLWMLLALLVSAASYADADLDKVSACMRGNLPPSVRMQQVELTSTDRSGGTRTLRGRLYAKSEKTPKGDRLRLLFKADEPADFAGAAYLVIEGENYLQDGMYVYLPSVGRVRRVSGTFADGTLLGTNFSYNDFRQLETAFVSSEALLEDSEKIEQRDAYVLSYMPASDAQSRYSLIRIWVDQLTCVPVKMELREGLKEVKELTAPAAGLQKSANRWYASQVQMRDLNDGTSSVLHITGTAIGVNIPGSYFDPATFYIGK